MGLDMYSYRVEKEQLSEEVPEDYEGYSLPVKNDEVLEEVMYWRKHHDLHGAMFSIAEKKGFTDGAAEFNAVDLNLTLQDLDSLEAQVREGTLPSTTGFFFGSNPPDNESTLLDLAWIAEAKDAIKSGDYILYSSWW